MVKKGLFILVGLMLIIGSSVTAEDKKPTKEGTNMAFELNLRIRNNVDEDVVSDQGFQIYEMELFLDSTVNDNASVFVEYPLAHKNALNLGNAWLDLHKAGELAATEQTGLMIGNFAPLVGYLNYDDNQSWAYGGRTTTNTTLMRGQSIDSQKVRDRQLGVAGGYKINDSFFAQVHLFDGSGPIEKAGGADNDKKVDAATRVQYTMPNNLGKVGVGYWVSPGTDGATANTAGTQFGGAGAKHPRTIERTVVYFKYPNVNQATLPDFSLGGKPFMVYGEYMQGTAKAEKRAGVPASLQVDTDFTSYYLEGNFRLPLFMENNKVVGVLRYDYWDPDKDKSSNTLQAVTPSVKWEFQNNMYLTVGWEWYFSNGTKAVVPERDNDRLAVELAVWF
ncbi:MAG: hypothetical protein HZA49_06140 [Planctomycetes bacterium]|nr:hypothetical protein [Planctomycetota bacterium]